MTDRELLEAAAKAAGIVIETWSNAQAGGFVAASRMPERRERLWNPLKDDGDALRLAVSLRITLDFHGVSPTVQAYVVANMPQKPRWWARGERTWVSVEYVPEEMWSGREDEVRFANWYMQEYAGMVRGLEVVTRRAIVCAAAAMAAPKEGEA